MAAAIFAPPRTDGSIGLAKSSSRPQIRRRSMTDRPRAKASRVNRRVFLSELVPDAGEPIQSIGHRTRGLVQDACVTQGIVAPDADDEVARRRWKEMELPLDAADHAAVHCPQRRPPAGGKPLAYL